MKYSEGFQPIHNSLSELPHWISDRILQQIKQLTCYEPVIGIMGKTGAGKSSLCNALFAGDISPVSDVVACTRDPLRFIWSFYTLSNGGAFMAPDADSDDKWHLFNSMNGNGAQMSAEAAGIAICLIEYSHHACRTECDAMTEHYYRLRDYALQHPESSAILRIID